MFAPLVFHAVAMYVSPRQFQLQRPTRRLEAQTQERMKALLDPSGQWTENELEPEQDRLEILTSSE